MGSRGLTLDSAGRRVEEGVGELAVVHREEDGGDDPPHQALKIRAPTLGFQAPWRGRLRHPAPYTAGEGFG